MSIFNDKEGRRQCLQNALNTLLTLFSSVLALESAAAEECGSSLLRGECTANDTLTDTDRIFLAVSFISLSYHSQIWCI
jgi:hypothetical protein